MNLKTSDVIQRISVYPDFTVKQVLENINETGMGLVLVVAPNTRSFLRLLTDGDIRRAVLSGHGLESRIFEIPFPESSVVATIDDDSEMILSKLNSKIRFIPILDQDGVVIDFVKWDKSFKIPVSSPLLGLRELELVTECISSGWISSAGSFVTKFENMMANYCQTRFAVSTSSGTTALHLALLAIGVKPGDEVIVPTLSFIASANAITYTGATPIFVDVDPSTWTISPAEIERALTSKTRAIVVVHLYGHPADMNPILDLAQSHDIHVIEDAAQAHGAIYKGKRVGGFGSAGIFSFFGNKIVTTGEGGMITTNSDGVQSLSRILRDHGMSIERKYWHERLGYNYRLTNIQAAIGVAQLEKIDSIIARKKELARYYDAGLAGIPGLTLPHQSPWADHVYWLYTIVIDPLSFRRSRDRLRDELKARGIDTRIVFPPIHSQPIYSTGQDLPVAQYISENGLSLPSSPNLGKDELDRIISAIRQTA